MSERNPALGGKYANSGQPNRKVMKRLNRRITDWASNSKLDPRAYHKPGSMQLR